MGERTGIEWFHHIADRLYFASAMLMPMRWQWQLNYKMRARFYFEQRTKDSWPWAWVAIPADPSIPLICDFGTPLYFDEKGHPL